MRLFYLLSFATFSLFLTACQSSATAVGVSNASPKVARTTATKRINTTQCNDSDDWYLDGYRVGKSFTAQKAQMFSQRLSYCQFTAHTLPARFKSNWERGFRIGIQQSPPTSTRKRNKKG